MVPTENGLFEWIRANEEDYVVFDDVTGVELDPRLVAGARKLEVEYIRRMGVYTRAPRVQAQKKRVNSHSSEVD